MPDSSPAVRQWTILRILSARRHGATIRDLATELQVSLKTVRRDLDTLTQTGFPIEGRVEDFGRKSWRIDADWSHASLTLTFDEALALCLGRRFLEPLAGTLFWEAAQSSLRKIQAGLGERVLKYLEKMAPRFHATTTGASDYTSKSDILDTLMIAIEDHRAVFITYQSARATEPVTYDIYPYGVTYHRGSLYAIGYAPRREEVRRWKLDRIEQADPTEVKFQRPEDFDLRKHLELSFGVYHGEEQVLVRVRFSRDVARYVREKRWSAKQKLIPRTDGGLLAEFQLSNTVEIKSWILSFGRHAEALEPVSLRQDIAEEIAQLAARYQVDGADDGKADTSIRKGKTRG